MLIMIEDWLTPGRRMAAFVDPLFQILTRCIMPAFAMGLLAFTTGCSEDPVPADLAERSDAAADQFQSRLHSELGQALTTGGTVGAVAVCAGGAPAIAAEVSERSGFDVRRISLRPRNPGAATDARLSARLQRLAEMPLAPDGRPMTARWTEGEGASATHFSMRAVVMQDQPCSACHGSTIAPAVRAAIAERYPEDRATGYRAGELRGAILTSWPRRGQKTQGSLR